MNKVLKMKEFNAQRYQQCKEKEQKDWIEARHRCEICGKIMTKKFGSGRFCSTQCSHKASAISNNEQRIANIVKSANHNPIKPKVKGNIIETYWIEYISNHYPSIKVESQVKVDCPNIKQNNHFYRLDILLNGSVNIEIDGYHPDNRDTTQRDSFLCSKGIRVVRVPYINPKRQQEKLDNLIKNIIESYC